MINIIIKCYAFAVRVEFEHNRIMISHSHRQSAVVDAGPYRMLSNGKYEFHGFIGMMTRMFVVAVFDDDDDGDDDE